MSRQTILDLLKKLLPAQFEEVVFKFGMPPEYLPPGTQAERAIALVHYAEVGQGGLEKLLAAIEQVNSQPRKNLTGFQNLSGLTPPPPGDFQYDVFLSHTSADKPRVRRLANKLKEAGLRVWLDEWFIKPGDSIPLAIERGLETSCALVLCMSPALFASEWVKHERGAVMFRDPANQGRRFVPLLLEDCEIPASLRQFAYVDWRGEDEVEWEKLVAACTDNNDYYPAEVTTASSIMPDRIFQGFLHKDSEGVFIDMEPKKYIVTERRVRVFYSYSHKDELLREQLERHLKLLNRQNIIDDWHDRKIDVGAEWKTTIDKNLETADIILLLISSDFLASDYCYDIEVKYAMRRHEEKSAVVVPILLRPCDTIDADFMRLQGLPQNLQPVTTWKNQDEAFANISNGIRNIAKRIVSPNPPPSTYK